MEWRYLISVLLGNTAVDGMAGSCVYIYNIHMKILEEYYMYTEVVMIDTPMIKYTDINKYTCR